MAFVTRPSGAKPVVATLLCALVLGAAAFAQERPPDPSDFVNALLGGLLGFRPVTEAELQKEVADVGGIAFKRDVPVDFITPQQMAKYFEELFDEEYPKERAALEERLLRTL